MAPGASAVPLPPKGPSTTAAGGAKPPPPPAPSTSAQAPKKPEEQAVAQRRPPKPKVSDEEVVERLRSIVTDADPTKLYKNFHKVGQGASGGVYTAIEIATGRTVCDKEMGGKTSLSNNNTHYVARDQADEPRTATQEGAHHQRDPRDEGQQTGQHYQLH